MNFFQKQSVAFTNDLQRSCGALLGIAQGLLADGELNDSEIRFLQAWLASNTSVTSCWPGDVIATKVNAVLADGVISDEERAHLVQVLQQLVGGSFEELPDSTHVSDLALDEVASINVIGSTFCLTGEFVYGSRGECERLLTERGAAVTRTVSKKLHYLVVGGLGSAEWKHGSFGTKVEQAMKLKAGGASLFVLHEDALMAAIFEKAQHAA